MNTYYLKPSETVEQFFISNREQVFNDIVVGIDTAIKNDDFTCEVFRIVDNNTLKLITANRDNFDNYLNFALEFYKNTEFYEKCLEVKSLI